MRAYAAAYELRFNLRRMPERLQHDAIALGEPEQRIELVLRRVGVELEFEPDVREADRRILCDAERAAKVEIALRRHLARAQRHAHRRRDRFQRHAGAGDQRLEQHVAGAELRAASPGRGVKPGDRKRPSGLDLAGDRGGVERALRPQRHQSRLRVGAVAVLERRLDQAHFFSVHFRASPSRSFTQPPVLTSRTAAAPRGTRSGRGGSRPRLSCARPFRSVRLRS